MIYKHDAIRKFQTTINAIALISSINAIALISYDQEACVFIIINFLFFSCNPWLHILCLVAQLYCRWI